MRDTDTGRILAFRGEYRFLSNFFVEDDGKTVEHRFQAAKATDPEERRWVLAASTPTEAKRRGQRVTLRPDWEQVKEGTMLFLLRIKFTPGSELARRLISTRGLVLQEGNTWGDDYWGVDLRTGDGKNRLGVLLMKVRSELLEFETVKAEIVDDEAGLWYES
jgi:ribA/ribD-fused uncharacterized protein